MSATVSKQVNPSVNPNEGLTAAQMFTWFDLAHQIQEQLHSNGNDPWFDPDTIRR